MWFLAWTGSGALIAFTALGLASIGIFVLPFAIAGTAAVRNRARFWPDGLGMGAGIGIMAIVIGVLNLGYRPCPSGSISLGPGQTSFECGGFDPVPWFVAGSLLVAASVLAYLFVRDRGAQASTSAGPTLHHRAWPWAVLGLWFILGIVPLVHVHASLTSHSTPFAMTISADHQISLLFGGGGYGSGGKAFTAAQQAAIERAYRAHPAGAVALALLAVIGFIAVRPGRDVTSSPSARPRCCS